MLAAVEMSLAAACLKIKAHLKEFAVASHSRVNSGEVNCRASVLSAISDAATVVDAEKGSHLLLSSP